MVKEVAKLEEIEHLANKLDLAEIINVAYVGSKPDKQKRNQRQFKSWQSALIGKINKLLKRARQTVWDVTGRKARRL